MVKNRIRPAVTVLLFAILLLCPGLRSAAETAEPAPQFAEIPISGLQVTGVIPQTDDAFGTLDWWYSEWDDCRYLFLPASADRTKLTITFSAAEDAPLTLNDTEVVSGAETGLLSTADTFAVRLGDTDCGVLRVMQSDRGSIWFSLEEGGAETLQKSKWDTVTGTALMLNADGSVEYRGALESLKGRGNSSWDYSTKKPYNFKLPKKASLYGMRSARKWALLSNYLDHSMLRNEIAFAMSRQSGLPYTTDSVFADLYIDGDYRGTYQLTERVLVNKHRVNVRDLKEETEALNPEPLSEYPRRTVGGTVQGEEAGSYQYYEIPNDPEDITGGYLFQFQLRGRSEKGEFITDRGQICDLTAPEYASKAQTEYIRAFMQELEDAAFSPDGYNSKGKHYSDYIDVDSLLLGYLIQEITANADGASTSFFFYKDSDSRGDGKLHYGPVWDFDLAFRNYTGTKNDPEGNPHYSLNADNIYALYTSPFLTALWEHDEFARRAAVLYAERFDSFLTLLTDESRPEGSLIGQLAADLGASAEMNRLRWHMYGGRAYKPLGPYNGETYAECVEYVRKFLAERQSYLQNEFLRISRTRCLHSLETALAAEPDSAYAPAELRERSALLQTYTEVFENAETAAKSERLLANALSVLDEIPKAELSGDFNEDGAVSLDDAQCLLRYYTDEMGEKHPKANATQRRNGDVDKNGCLDLSDAMQVLKHYTEEMGGKEYVLPVQPKQREQEAEP